MPGSRLAFPLFEAGELEVAEAVLSKIKELEQDDESVQERIDKTPVYHRKTDDPVKKVARCICHNLLDNKTGYKAHICGVCYQTYCSECLAMNFKICNSCKSDGKLIMGLYDKYDKYFFPGDTLRNESSLTTSVKILQINETYIVSEPGGVTEIQDFIDAGWIVHERVTTYRTDESGTICIDKCDFMSNEIGSLNCAECDHSQNKRGKDWIICELYNKENEDEN